MRGAYRRHSARSASRRPAPPAAIAVSSAASDASALIGPRRYHRAGSAVSDPESIGQGKESPPAVPLEGASVHQAQDAWLEPGELLQQRAHVGAPDQVRGGLVHRQRRPDDVRGAERRHVGTARREQVTAEERPAAGLEEKAALPPVREVRGVDPPHGPLPCLLYTSPSPR